MQKSYADVRRKELEFKVEDNVYLKVSPKDSIRFGYSKKFKIGYIGPIDIIVGVIDLANELALLPSLVKVHNVFYISMLKKYIWDEVHIIPDYKELIIQRDATCEEEPVRILDKQNKVLRRKTIPLVRVT